MRQNATDAVLSQELEPEDGDRGDPGAGRPPRPAPRRHALTAASATGWSHGEKQNIHYTAAIAASFVEIENAALSRRPNLHHRHSRTVKGAPFRENCGLPSCVRGADYIAELKKVFPRMGQFANEQFVATYEMVGDSCGASRERNGHVLAPGALWQPSLHQGGVRKLPNRSAGSACCPVVVSCAVGLTRRVVAAVVQELINAITETKEGARRTRAGARQRGRERDKGAGSTEAIKASKLPVH